MTESTVSKMPLDSLMLSKPSSEVSKNPEKLKDACAEIESLFIYYLLKEMRNTVPKSGLMGGTKTEETYQSMLDLQLSKDISSKREIGIASMLYGQLGGITESNKQDKGENETMLREDKKDESTRKRGLPESVTIQV